MNYCLEKDFMGKIMFADSPSTYYISLIRIQLLTSIL